MALSCDELGDGPVVPVTGETVLEVFGVVLMLLVDPLLDPDVDTDVDRCCEVG